MARLPDIAYRPVNAEEPSRAVVRPTDLGFGQAAQEMGGWQREREHTKALQDRVQREEDDKAAQPILDELRTSFGRKAAEAGEVYDGAAPGWAKSTIETLEADAQPLLARTDLAPGVQAAVRRGYDAYRASVGQKAVEFEAAKAGRRVAEREAVRRSAEQGHALAGYMESYAATVKPVDDGFDGTQPASDYVAAHLHAHDEAAAKAIEAVPEADRPSLQIRLNAERLDVLTRAQARAEKGEDVYLVDKARDTGARLANAIRTSPGLFARAEEGINTAVAALPPEVRADHARYLRNQTATARIEGLIDNGQHELAVKELNGGGLDGWLEPSAKDALLGKVKGDAAKRAEDAIQALTYGGDFDADALARDAALSGDVGLKAKADYALEVGAGEPGALATLGSGGGVGGGFDNAFAFTYEREGGDQIIPNDNGRGPSRGGINQAAHPEVDVTKLTPAQQKARYRRYWQAVGAARLPPGLGLAAFDAAVLHGADDAKRWLAEANGDVGTFLALQRGYMRQLAKNDPVKYGDDLKGWLNRTVKVQKEAARLDALVNVQEGLASDPIKFAMGTGKRRPIAQVPALPGSPAEPGWGEALKGRLEIGRLMNRQYRAPLRMLTDGEQAFYRDQIDRDPLAGIELAARALESVGPAAARSLMAELGQKDTATVQLHLADLAASGQPNFARTAATGLALKAKGSTLDKDLKGEIDAALEARKGLFTGQPELRGVVRAAAEAAALAQSETGTAQRGVANVNSALGGSVRAGRLYGGVGEVNGAEVILPGWLAQDHADDVLEFLAEGWGGKAQGPVWADGREIPAATIARMQMRLMPNGKYRLLDRRGAAMLAAGGGAFEFDLDAAAPGLRQRFGRTVVQDGF
ncbi:glycosyl hydrolase 108 family protein [Phenylobacterium sp.]|uniref:glycosyl hydrolase 108 family protein n=1 Tax=Phenylobacterium sp. TaxID=1871053 RepID=UPI002FCAC3FF